MEATRQSPASAGVRARGKRSSRSSSESASSTAGTTPSPVSLAGTNGATAQRGPVAFPNAGKPTRFAPKFSKSLASYFHFFWAGLCRHEQTGGIIPSQKFLIEKMIAPVPRNYAGEIVELGTGSGALTLRLAARCARARILACEINPTLARDTRENLLRARLTDRVQVVSDSAENVLGRLTREGRFVDYILSGIPLGNLDRGQSFALINCIHSALRPGGMYIQFQHSLLDRKKIEVSFSRLRTVQAFLNIPPAVVYYAQK